MNIGGFGSVPYISVSALDAFATGMQAIAHNIANVNTAGFQPQAVYYSSLPPYMGVQVGDITGPGQETVPVRQPEPETVTAPVPEQQIGVLPPPPDDLTSFMPPEWLNPSHTSLEREMTNMIMVQRAYEANTVPIRVWDEMTGTLVNLTT
ncbi:MAG: flagellar basal body protein [Deltaproteobacteria bacterium]|jgi:flagellar basal-body rod protein FlgC|nr:flagellar basal body protein [Deltaproteobacteria bacterium]